jgi:hypothetical protein
MNIGCYYSTEGLSKCYANNCNGYTPDQTNCESEDNKITNGILKNEWIREWMNEWTNEWMN